MIQKFEFKELEMKGAYEITPFYATDERGGFIKDYNIDMFKANGIEHELKEVFYTISKKGVIRAMHFQLVKQQAKLVRCISGHVYDVIIDLRPDSPTFGKWQGFDLTGENQKRSMCLSFLDMAILCSKTQWSATSAEKYSMAKVTLASCTMTRIWALSGHSRKLVALRI